MNYFSSCTKVTMGGLLVLFSLFFVPISVSADGNVSSTPLGTLEQIEPLISDGPEVLAALSAIARDEALEALERQRTGAKYFAGVTYGFNNEPIFDTMQEKNKYKNLSLTGGLNFPMLGTLQKEKIGKIQAETVIIESKHHANMLRLNNLVALRKAYTTLWIEQQKDGFIRQFLNTEEETVHILQERQVQGLVLPVDRLEFLTVYYDAKREIAASKLRQTQALNIICLATGREWNINEKLSPPSLPIIDGKQIDLNTYPEVVFQNQLVSQYEKMVAENEQLEREANLTIGLTGTHDFPGSMGNSAYITFSVTEPVKTIGGKDQAKLAAANNFTRAKKEESFIRSKLDGQVQAILATTAYAAADVTAHAVHLIVMAESIREKMLRRTVLPGETFEQLQHSKSQYYKTALDMLDNEEKFLQSTIDIISYVYPTGLGFQSIERIYPINENDTVRNNLLSPNWLDSNNKQNNISVPLDFSDIPDLKAPIINFISIEKRSAIPAKKMKAAVYVWNAEPFLQSDTRTAALNEIINAGFSRVLISFTHKQILNFLSPKGKEELDTLIALAKSKGVRIDLMLGDPKWAEMDQRGELLSLIKQLEIFDFDGIHLDIEPDSLPGASVRRAELLEGLADTIKAVKEITRLPVAISIHPRYLEGDLGGLARRKLLSQGLDEVIVMIYSDNPHSTAQRMSAIITSNPNVNFSLAQSVEKNISLAESYADSSQQQFVDAMRTLEEKLAIYGIKGIFIQSWEDYKKGENNEGLIFSK